MCEIVTDPSISLDADYHPHVPFDAAVRNAIIVSCDKPKTELVRQQLLRLVLFAYVLFFVAMEVFVIMPALFSEQPDVYLMYFLLGLYFFIGFVSSTVRIIWANPTIQGRMLVNRDGDKQWTYCISCQSVRPPRAHHCQVCDICVLRRDHHCVVLAKCIGLENLRYFLSFQLFSALGCGFATRLNLQFVFGQCFFPSDWSTPFRLFCLFAPPGLPWIIRLTNFWQTIIFIHTTVPCFLFLCLIAYFLYYVNLMLSNQTLSERTARSKALAVEPSKRSEYMVRTISTFGLYNVTPLVNIKQVLGNTWFLGLLFPFISSTLPTDGLSFPMSDATKYR